MCDRNLEYIIANNTINPYFPKSLKRGMEDCSVDGQGGDGINSRGGWNQFKRGMEADHQCPTDWDPGVDLWGGARNPSDLSLPMQKLP